MCRAAEAGKHTRHYAQAHGTTEHAVSHTAPWQHPAMQATIESHDSFATIKALGNTVLGGKCSDDISTRAPATVYCCYNANTNSPSHMGCMCTYGRAAILNSTLQVVVATSTCAMMFITCSPGSRCHCWAGLEGQRAVSPWDAPMCMCSCCS